MSWMDETKLRDVPEEQGLEATCIRCRYTWIEDPTLLLLKVEHRDVYLSEVATNLCCPRCRNTGVRLSRIRMGDTSGFVGGMP